MKCSLHIAVWPTYPKLNFIRNFASLLTKPWLQAAREQLEIFPSTNVLSPRTPRKVGSRPWDASSVLEMHFLAVPIPFLSRTKSLLMGFVDFGFLSKSTHTKDTADSRVWTARELNRPPEAPGHSPAVYSFFLLFSDTERKRKCDAQLSFPLGCLNFQWILLKNVISMFSGSMTKWVRKMGSESRDRNSKYFG